MELRNNENAKTMVRVERIEYESLNKTEYVAAVGVAFADVTGDGFVSKAQIAKAYPDTKEDAFIPKFFINDRFYKTFAEAEKVAKEYADKTGYEYIQEKKEIETT